MQADSHLKKRSKKKLSLYVMAGLYIAAGINHFVHSSMYMAIMPPYIPWHLPLVYISGVFEILFGLLLIPVTTRRIAALGIILLLVAVFPANIQMTLNYVQQHHPYTWVSILRLPLQLVLIWWAYKFYKRPRFKKA